MGRAKALTPEQIRETLRRHGLQEDAEVLGITYADPPTVNLAGARLAVPDDVLAMEAMPVESPRKTLFSRPE